MKTHCGASIPPIFPNNAHIPMHPTLTTVGNDSAVKHDRTANPAATNSLSDKHRNSSKFGCCSARFVSSIVIKAIRIQKETIEKPMIVVLRPSLQ